jgi:hypothetical protein
MRFVSELLICTVAPGTTASLASRAVPVTLAEETACAMAADVEQDTMAMAIAGASHPRRFMIAPPRHVVVRRRVTKRGRTPFSRIAARKVVRPLFATSSGTRPTRVFQQRRPDGMLLTGRGRVGTLGARNRERSDRRDRLGQRDDGRDGLRRRQQPGTGDERQQRGVRRAARTHHGASLYTLARVMHRAHLPRLQPGTANRLVTGRLRSRDTQPDWSCRERRHLARQPPPDEPRQAPSNDPHWKLQFIIGPAPLPTRGDLIRSASRPTTHLIAVQW